jgi:hypothetical protein
MIEQWVVAVVGAQQGCDSPVQLGIPRAGFLDKGCSLLR